MSLARILVLTTGGTIAMTPGSSGAIVPTLSGADLVGAVPALAQAAQLQVESYSSKPGASLTLRDLAQIAARIDKSFADGCVGAVVVQGTDTIEETAFGLELLVHGRRPVVVTGAMRGAQAPGADGPANLLAAAIVAASPEAAGLGALVVLGDQVHAARRVQKTHTMAPSAFASPGFGPLGLVCEGRLHLQARLDALPALELPAEWAEPAVALVKITLGDDGRLLPALPGLGYQGAVIEAMGAGHVPPALAPLVGDLAAHMPVVLGTRVCAGPVLRASYAFPGSETDLLARGAMAGGSLGGLKACLLLRLLLAAGLRGERLRREYSRRCASLPA